MQQLEDTATPSMVGRAVGVYRLEEEVGRGGMGVVYRASRTDGEFNQTVAIKLIKRGMDTDLILKRFRRERQITAALNHPNIAYFFGGGSTDDGLPYFVMEFIVGRPLYRYCDENRLTIRERLQIFRQICWAVSAAHEINVIHRDLKPSNVLVKADGKPKLLDFGIAKVLDPALMATEIDPTETGRAVMTPEYASPEQIGGEPVGIGSDIYSLGVILYELLTGHRPYRVRRGAREAAAVIRESIPTNPSVVLTRDDVLMPLDEYSGSSLDAVLKARRASLEALRKELTGDLDRIVLKALRKNPKERYQTAIEFADDISNYLEGRPVDAEFFASMPRIPLHPTAEKTSLAILPFRVLGGADVSDTGDEFLGVGLADALISRLSGLDRIVVRPTSSVLPFDGEDPLKGGRALGVDFVLGGVIRNVGGRVRVSAQLLEVKDRATRWADAFDAELGDVLGLEDSLSDTVARALLPELTGEEQRRLERRSTRNPAAYQAYLRGRYFWSRFTDEYLARAIEAFKEAIELDPEYALPYIGLADYYIWSSIFGEIPSIEGFAAAQDAVRRALEIDPLLGEAYAVLAFCVLLSEWNWKDAEELLKRGIELSPNYGFAREAHSNFLCAQGRFDEAIEEILRAEELDPVSPKAILMTAWTLYQSRRFDESVEKALKANAMQENFPQALLHLANALSGAGRPKEALPYAEAAYRLWSGSGLPGYILCHVYAENGLLDRAQGVIEDMLTAREKGYFKPHFLALGYVAVGDIDKAFEWLDRSADENSEWMIWLATEPRLDILRTDPRYQQLLSATGNPLAVNTAEPYTGGLQRSIAVLPFQTIGSRGETAGDADYLGIGLADAVTMRLSAVRRFLLRPTSSVLPCCEVHRDSFAAGRTLGVDFIVDGIIRHVGSNIRVTAQLLDVAEGSTRWSASFSEPYSDVLQLEDSISEQVTKQLVPHLTGGERFKLTKRGTNKPEAHDAYLQGRYFWNQFTPDAFPKAIAAFETAVSLDPDYALAHVGIADYYTWACIYGMISPTEGFPHVLESASRALELDPDLPEAHAAIGLYHSNTQDWGKAEQAYRKALELSPNYPLAHEWLSALLVGTGRYEEGVKEVLLAEQLDPLSLRSKVLSAWTIYQVRDYDQALTKAREIETLNPDFLQSHLQLANIMIELHEYDTALAHARRSVDLAGGSALPFYVLCNALSKTGRNDEASKLRDEWEGKASSMYVPPYFLGMCDLGIGDLDSAFEMFDQAQAEKSAWMLWFGTEPKLDPIRKDPRYLTRLEATGNPIRKTFAE